MKRFLCLILSLAGIAAMICSCEETDGDATGAAPLYGVWVLDNLTIEASTSVTGSQTTVIDYARTPAYLTLDENLVATARMGLDLEVAKYSFDVSTNTVSFSESLSVSNDGKAMILTGAYEVTTATATQLVLRQPDFSIDIPGLVSANQTAIYTFHKETE